MNQKRSKCCNASVIVEGDATKFYVCTECRKSCDVIVGKREVKKPYKVKPRPSAKQILKSQRLKASLDERWRGLINSEKEEVLAIFDKVNKKRLMEIEDNS